MSFIPTPHTGDLTLGWREVCSFRTRSHGFGPRPASPGSSSSSSTGSGRKMAIRTSHNRLIQPQSESQATGLPTQTVVVCRVLPYEERIQGVLFQGFYSRGFIPVSHWVALGHAKCFRRRGRWVTKKVTQGRGAAPPRLFLRGQGWAARQPSRAGLRFAALTLDGTWPRRPDGLLRRGKGRARSGAREMTMRSWTPRARRQYLDDVRQEY